MVEPGDSFVEVLLSYSTENVLARALCQNSRVHNTEPWITERNRIRNHLEKKRNAVSESGYQRHRSDRSSFSGSPSFLFFKTIRR